MSSPSGEVPEVDEVIQDSDKMYVLGCFEMVKNQPPQAPLV